jgi:hypothetical protein
MPEHRLTKLDKDFYQVQYADTQGKPQRVGLAGMDFHAMGKRDLGEIVETDSRTRLLDSCH